MAPLKIGVFGPEGSPVVNALTTGLRLIHNTTIHQNASAWSETQATSREFDAVFVPGRRGTFGDVAAFYSKHGVPVYTLDAPHLRMLPGQYRLERHAVGPRLPKFDGPVNYDRISAQGITAKAKTRAKGQHILFCGQLRADASHGLGLNGYPAWVPKALATVRSLDPSDVVWRPHPDDVFAVEGFDGSNDPAESTLQNAFAKTWLVVTHCSGSGIDALIAGIPVVAFGNPIYKELAFSTESWKDINPPKPEVVQEFLARLAYTQWTLEEIATGVPLKHLLEERPFPGAVPEEVAEPAAPVEEPARPGRSPRTSAAPANAPKTDNKSVAPEQGSLVIPAAEEAPLEAKSLEVASETAGATESTSLPASETPTGKAN